MQHNWPEGMRERLEKKREELTVRLERVTANLRRGLHSDSEEQAKQLSDSEVVDALGNEAREELKKISAALRRMEAGDYGLCIECGEPIAMERIKAYPYASACIDCAEMVEEIESRPG